MGERVWELRPQINVIAGRGFKPGLNELLVGQGVHGQFAGIDIGASMTLNGKSWTVVGLFNSGDAYDSEIWGDTNVVASAFRRGNTSLAVRLTDAGALGAFNAGIARDPRLRVYALTTRQYYAEQSEGLARNVRILGLFVRAIMAIGAVFGALHTMYSAVAGRAREIATLRALGFHRFPMIVSVLLEMMLLASFRRSRRRRHRLGDLRRLHRLDPGYEWQCHVRFKVSPVLAWNGLQFALAIGFIGGLFPAVRAAGMPITCGLRQL